MAGNNIELVDLTKFYGSHVAVDHLNLKIEEGEIFGLLGPNGAGKSTSILMMLGLTEPTSGSVKVCGIDSTVNPIEVKRKVGYLPEDVGFYDDLTGLENLIYTAQLNSISVKEAKQRAEKLLAKVGLSYEKEKKTGKYSRGMRQRLGLADVLIKNPKIIILDEPTLGIDPSGVREFLEMIVALSREEGLTVLFSSHHLHQVQQVCDRVGIFVSGKLLAEGNIQSLSAKLFSNSPFLIEVGFTGNSKSFKENEKENWFKNILKDFNGIKSITLKDKIFQIESSLDLTAQLAKLIVDSKAELTHLNKKEFGLDDIYYRYFEGAEKP